MEKRTFQDINTLIELFENSDWRELSIEVEDFSLHLSRDEGAAGPAWQPSPVARERPQDNRCRGATDRGRKARPQRKGRTTGSSTD